MAYFTQTNLGRAFTADEQTSRDNYIAAQVAAGTTDGNMYTWTIQQPTTTDDGLSAPTQNVRMWSTLEAGNGFLTLINSFTPPPVSAKIY